MRPVVSFSLLVAMTVSGPIFAETVDVTDFIARCDIAIKYNGDVASVAVPLSKMSGLDLTPDNRTRGLECLKKHFGFQFYFDSTTNSFAPDKDDMEKTKPAREAAQRKEDEEAASAKARQLEREAKENEKKKQQDAAYEARRLERMEDDETQRREEANKDELNRRIRKACYDTLVTNPLQAVTQPICQDIFVENGFDRPKDVPASKP